MRRIAAEGNGDGLIMLLCLGRCLRSAVGGSGGFVTTVVRNLTVLSQGQSITSSVYVLCPPGLETHTIPLTTGKDGQFSEPPGWCKGTAAIARETTI